MGKYSSDSDTDKRKSSHKGRTKHRSSSSSSSDSRTRRRKRRSRSRDKYSRSRRSRSSSAHKSKSRRSERRYRDRHHRSRSRSKNKYRRSRSKSYIREYTKSKRRSTSSSSSPDSAEITKRDVAPEENLSVTTERHNKSPETSQVDVKTLSAINEDNFVQKVFTSSKSKKLDNIVIDLKKQTIKVPEVEPLEPDSIFHHNLFLSEEARMEKWIKELYGFRQKALQQGYK